MITKELKKRIYTSLILLLLITLISSSNAILVFSLIVLGVLSVLEFINLINKTINNKFYSLISNLFFVVYILGLDNLLPHNLDWLMSGDRLGELIGWLNFKNANWSFPLGNYSQGELGENSVVFNGTVPLLAIIFKFLFKESNNFQYFSFWILLCAFLQGFISYLIIYKLTNKNLYSIIGLIFIIIGVLMVNLLGNN